MLVLIADFFHFSNNDGIKWHIAHTAGAARWFLPHFLYYVKAFNNLAEHGIAWVSHAVVEKIIVNEVDKKLTCR